MSHCVPRGFSLIELLVVISIIAILGAILLPTLNHAQEAARQATCLANQQHITTAIWNYMGEHDGHVPRVESPLTNANFANTSRTDDELDPFDRERWPASLPNVLMPDYLDENHDAFACPGALRGWPREASGFHMAYRPASINQPNGVTSLKGSYFRENFGFLDGRKFEVIRVELSGNPMLDAQRLASAGSTHLRDMVMNNDEGVIGPHFGGINVINRNLEAEYRDREATLEQLAGFGRGVEF